MRSVFHFRHFDLLQDESVMKAGTDSVLLGSLCRQKDACTILDIGTGTGILALMAAQRFESARIIAIDRDTVAIGLAKENAAGSPWNERITCVASSLQDYVPQAESRFDLVISNPPYFKNNGQYTSAEREAMRATAYLSFGELVAGVAALLSQEGSFWVVLPVQESIDLEVIAMEQGLYPHTIWNISSFQGKQPIRRILGLSRQQESPETFCLSIYSEPGKHSGAYIEATAEFYPGTGKFFDNYQAT